MKYISITFDDGRSDNYDIAFQILKKYGLNATFFVVTGYIDDEYHDNKWKTSDLALKKPQIIEMYEYGCEIASHGDRHITEIKDYEISVKKLNKVLKTDKKFGFSVPNSLFYFDECSKILDLSKIEYIRVGRDTRCYTVLNKLRFLTYNIIKCEKSYNKFNFPNIIDLLNMNVHELPSIVIKSRDNVDMMMSFINTIPDNSWCIFMFHSILKKEDELYDRDVWFFDALKFEMFCKFLAERVSAGEFCVDTVINIIKR